MKRFLVLVVALMTGCITVQVQGESLDNEPRIEESIYRVGADRGWGTGFAVKTKSGKTVIVTNAHVCEIADFLDDAAVYDNDGHKSELEIIAKSTDHDLCIVEAPLDAKPLPVSWKRYTPTGTKIFTAGYPSIRYLTRTKGEALGLERISLTVNKSKEQCNVDPYRIEEVELRPGLKIEVCVFSAVFQWTSARISSGASGSPVVNEEGEVVGVVAIATASEAGFMGMVPLRNLKWFLSQF